MDISLSLRQQRGAAEDKWTFFSIASRFINLFLRSSNNHFWTRLHVGLRIIIPFLLPRKSSAVHLPTARRTTQFCFFLLISLFLAGHVVGTIHHHHHKQHNNKTNHNNNTNSSNGTVDTTRHTRNTGTNNHGQGAAASQAMVMRPEFFLVPIGGVIHLFPRYGYLSLSMKVISKNGSGAVQNDTWMFLEPVNNVIEPTTLKVDETKFSTLNETDSLPFHNLFHFDLCEDVRALMEAYFKKFTIEGLDKPWQAWVGGWRSAAIARNFGIEQHFVEGDYRFVLVKVMLVRGSGTVEDIGNSNFAQAYASNFQRFLPNNELSTYEFFKVVGTHYIHSYIMGNSVYQVFVYDPDGFQAVKRRLFFDGIKDATTTGSAEPILESLTTWVKHIGQVGVLNAEPDVTEAVRKALVMHNSFSQPSPNLLKLHDNASLVKQVELLLASQPNGILGIDLRGIQFLFKDPIQRAGFEKALKHKMQLWEINFLY